MTKTTPLANWITNYTDNRGGDVIRALHDLATDLGLHDHQESAEPLAGVDARDSRNPARAHDAERTDSSVSTSRAHEAAEPTVEPIRERASDTETVAQVGDE